MAVAGLRGTGNWADGERPKNFREIILWRNPKGGAPLTALMSKMKKRVTDDPEFSWYEEEQKTWRGLVNGAIANTTGTAVVIDSGDAQELKAGDLLLVETAEDVAYSAEILQVATTPTTTTGLTVTRGASGSTPASIPDNTYLTKIGSAYGEGTGAPDASTRNPTKYYNLAQIFKEKYALTGTASETRTRTGDPIANDKKRKMFDYSAHNEFAMIFGKRFETTGSNGKPLRYMGGLLYFLAAKYNEDTVENAHCMKIWTTTPTEDTFLNAVYKQFDWETSEGGGNERIVLAGNGYLNSLNKMVKNSSSTRFNYEGTIDVYGMELQKYVLPQGTLYFRTHPLFNKHSRFTNSALFINPPAITYRPMKNRDTKFKDNIQANDADGIEGQWIGEFGVEFNHLSTMSYHGNFIV